MNIYFCGSMTHNQEKMLFYKELIDYLENYGSVLNKFVGEVFQEKDDLEVYERDTSNLKKTDILIADTSVVSSGVGFELGYADLLGIDTLVIYDTNYKKPSSLVLGSPNFEVKTYNSLEEAKEIITDFCEKKEK